jgi:homoaconitase/3-isopropylmalate dehydratase large subunit
LGRTLAEKILTSKSASDLKAGDIAIGMVDLIFVQDTTGPLTVPHFEASGFKKLSNLKRSLIFPDHAVPSSSRELPNFRTCPGSNVAYLGRGWAG